MNGLPEKNLYDSFGYEGMIKPFPVDELDFSEYEQ